MSYNEDSIKSNLVNIKNNNKTNLDYVSKKSIKNVRKFHKTFDEYSVTPLYKLENLAKYYGFKNIFLKDESYRFGLNAFKVLGGAYAIGKYLANELNMDISELSFDYLRSPKVKKELGQITFVTATDGNHGRGVAWAAKQLGQKAVIYMPKVASKTRVDNIRKEGAEVNVIDGNYDDAVAISDEMAKKNNWVVIQDTAWDGYEDIPTWIMQGYATIVDEAIEQLNKENIEKPTHVFLQAGVGSFAGSILGYLASKFGEDRPITIIMEPNDADCLYKSSLTGQREIVNGDMPTIMAGLACGSPNTISYEILKNYADGYLSCPDYVAAKGMRILASPLKGDPQIISGESGAIGAGVISLLMERNEYKSLRQKLNLNNESIILLISTEGDTDPQKYKDIVWDGDCNSMKY